MFSMLSLLSVSKNARIRPEGNMRKPALVEQGQESPQWT